MPRGGNNRLPAASKALRGTLRAKREPAIDEVPPSVVGPPPKAFSATQRAAWVELTPQVQRVFTERDRAAFGLLVRLWVVIGEPSLFAKPSAGARLVQIVSGLLQQFGCTPASRGRVAPASDDPDDETGRFLFGGKPRDPLDEFAVKKVH